MKWIWSHFPFFYILPFLLATSRFEQASGPNEILRWVVLAVGCGFAFYAGNQQTASVQRRLMFTDRWMLLFLGIFLLSTIWSFSPIYTAMRTASLVLLYICSMWTLWIYADQFSEGYLISRALNILAVVLVINLIVGGLLFPAELLDRRFQGLFVNPNNIGILVGVGLPLAIGRWLQSRSGFTVVLILGANLVACGTRSALLGVAVACFVFLIPLFVRRPVWALSLAVAGVFGGALFSQTTLFHERILREDTLKSGSTRTRFWEIGKEYINNRPWVGHGFGTDSLIHEYYGVSLRDIGLRGHGVMSSYHGMAIQIGRPATYLYFGLLWGFCIWCLVTRKDDFLLISYIGTLISGLIVCIFEPAIYSAGNCFSFLFWMVFMLAVRRHYYIRKQVKLSPMGTVFRYPHQRILVKRASPCQKNYVSSQVPCFRNAKRFSRRHLQCK